MHRSLSACVPSEILQPSKNVWSQWAVHLLNFQ
ncbi:TPA: hypothetical protein N0F65_010797 [Lagenidium giganteum]|uniref:Uncharacterized protein n=1 Tax=Lagenidium giganteum TaxID=4803 RepID=A0AAV2YGU8_9STRA|nr:TPA: hypothetical protein N0F65_010797 [Lagenidium giganteum]